MTTQDRAAEIPAPRSGPSAFFIADGDTFVPQPIARGPWGETISGNYVGGILGHVLDRDAGDPEFQPARLTVDLFRPAALAPVRVDTTVTRQGRRLRLVDAVMTQSDTVVARASGLFLRRGEQPTDEIWSSAVDDAARSSHTRSNPAGLGDAGVDLRQERTHPGSGVRARRLAARGTEVHLGS